MKRFAMEQLQSWKEKGKRKPEVFIPLALLPYIVRLQLLL